MKKYISTAQKLGYINGVPCREGVCFEATREITRAEAAQILANILDVSSPTIIPTFSDSGSIPAWAAPAIYSMNSIGVMHTYSGNISASAAVTRGDAAQILSNLMSFVD